MFLVLKNCGTAPRECRVDTHHFLLQRQEPHRLRPALRVRRQCHLHHREETYSPKNTSRCRAQDETHSSCPRGCCVLRARWSWRGRGIGPVAFVAAVAAAALVSAEPRLGIASPSPSHDPALALPHAPILSSARGAILLLVRMCCERVSCCAPPPSCSLLYAHLVWAAAEGATWFQRLSRRGAMGQGASAMHAPVCERE